MVWSSLELLEIFLENKGKNKKCTKEKLYHLSLKQFAVIKLYGANPSFNWHVCLHIIFTWDPMV